MGCSVTPFFDYTHHFVLGSALRVKKTNFLIEINPPPCMSQPHCQAQYWFLLKLSVEED